MLGHSGARLVFCEDAAQAAKIARGPGTLPEPRARRHVPRSAPPARSRGGAAAPRAEGDRAPSPSASRRSSPTTWPPSSTRRGRPGRRRAACSRTATCSRRRGCTSTSWGSTTRTPLYQFLPLAHVLARVAQAVVLRAGAARATGAATPTKIIDELAEVAPTHFPAVPRIYEKVHGAVIGRVEDGSPLAAAAVRLGAAHGGRHRARLAAGRQPLGAGRRVQYRARRPAGAVQGPARLRRAPADGARRRGADRPRAAGVLRRLRRSRARGLRPDRELRGRDAQHRDARCASARSASHCPGPRCRSRPTARSCFAGRTCSAATTSDAEATQEALTADGWLRTGDLGAIDDDGFLAITGRKKDLIITSSGKNITPVNIESALRETRYITEAVVYGDDRPYLVACSRSTATSPPSSPRQLGIPADPATIADDPRVREQIQQDVDAVNAKLARIEQIKRFAILDHDLTQADGELTPTLKVKRAVVYEQVRGLVRRSVRRSVSAMSTAAMSSADAAWLHMDRPTNLMVINSVLLFDEPIDLSGRARSSARAGRPLPAFSPARGREPPAAAAARIGRTIPTSTSTTTCTTWRCPPRATARRCRSSSAI